MRLEKERMVHSNGRVTELEDDAMLPPAGTAPGGMPARASATAAAPEVGRPTPVETPVLRDRGVQPTTTS